MVAEQTTDRGDTYDADQLLGQEVRVSLKDGNRLLGNLEAVGDWGVVVGRRYAAWSMIVDVDSADGTGL